LTEATAPLVSIIVPVFNEAATVSIVIGRLLHIDLPAAREIIVVNDGSTDGTRAALESMTPNPIISVIECERNRGKGFAVRTGLTRSRGSVIAIQDADLELDPAQLAGLVAPVLSGEADVVYGSRFLSPTDAPFMTVAGNKLLTAITNLLFRSTLTDMETCYKVMRGDVARSLVLSADRFDIEPEITARLLRRGHRIVERPVRFSARSRSAGKKIRWRDGWMALRVLVVERFRGR
jgi:glycosyltransferase involved in cell wall biosynthesis